MKRNVGFRRTIVLETEVEVEVDGLDRHSIQEAGRKQIGIHTQWKDVTDHLEWVFTLDPNSEMYQVYHGRQ